jgi:hypothetical protein
MKQCYMVETVSFRRGIGMTTTRPTTRTLTVSSLYRQWGEPHRKRECIVPSIRLNGQWLAALGFVSGKKISVATNGTAITITPFQDEGERIAIDGIVM